MVLIVAVAWFFYSCGKRHTGSMSNPPTASMTNTTNSTQMQHNTMSATSGTGNVQFQGGLFNPQAPLNAQNSTFNYYFSPLTNTVTRDAFESFEAVISNAMSNTTEKIVLTTQQVQLLAQALRDLDQRTSGIEKLPDGRTKLGSFVAGEPKVVIELFDAGIRDYTNGIFSSALENFQKCISVFEMPPPTNISISAGGGITPEGKTAAYWYAGVCAQKLGSNYLANEFAEKADKEHPDWQTKGLLVTTLANLANDECQKGKFTNSFELFQEAITNNDSMEITNIHKMTGIQLSRLYGSAAGSAYRIGRVNEATQYANKAAEIFGKFRNTTNAP